MTEVWDNKFGFVEVKGNSSEFSDLEDSYTDRMKEQDKARMEGEVIKISGVGKDAEIVVNERGGRQSKSPMAMHLVDPTFLQHWFESEGDTVIKHITNFMTEGDKADLIGAVFELNCDYGKTTNEDEAIITIAKVLQEGATKYKANNWRLIPQEEHINHALIHYMAHKLGDTQDTHLEHCMCRLMMAYATEKSENFDYTKFIG